MDEKYKALKVLVVDDHMMMRTMIKQHLQAIGFKEVETANDGQEALNNLKHAQSIGMPYNIVFLDWHMPNVEGYDVLKACRADKAYNKTAFIMLTAEQEEKNVLKAIQAGSTSYLIKPVAKEAIEKNLVKVFDWLEKQGYEFTKKTQQSKAENALDSLQIPEKVRRELGPVISKGVKSIFSELFQATILEQSEVQGYYKDQMVCIGRLQQNDIVIDIRFFFDRDLLHPLLCNIYAESFLQDNQVYEDAASEIVNILCGQIKAFMNQNGFDLKMMTPRIGGADDLGKGSDAFLNVGFSMNQADCFVIDMESRPVGT